MNENLQVRLATDVVYLYGIVNGVEATFTLVETGLWTTIVPKSVDGKYLLEITTYNSLGDATLYKATIYKLDSAYYSKIDWTSADYYNFSDIARVEANISYLIEQMIMLGYYNSVQPPQVEWNMKSFPYWRKFGALESDIDALRIALFTPTDYLGKKEWLKGMYFDYTDANRIERNLLSLLEVARLLKEGVKYSGTFNAGQDVIL